MSDKDKAKPAKKTGLFVTANNSIRANGVVFSEGDKVTGKDLASDTDPEGKAALKRLVDGGELAGKDDDAEPAKTDADIEVDAKAEADAKAAADAAGKE